MPLDVLVIDDSPFNRSALASMLASMDGVASVATAVDGIDGFRQALKRAPDLITLDLEMPNMDGLTFLRLFSSHGRSTPVLVVSSRPWDPDALAAFELGAVDYIEKPDARVSGTLFALKDELESKVVSLRSGAGVGRGERARMRIKRRPGSPDAVVIGASSGGPPAIERLVSSLPAELDAAVAIALHMPPWLTGPLVERLAARSRLPLRRAGDNVMVLPGEVLVSPGGCHLEFSRRGSSVYTRLEEETSEQVCSPSVDRLFETAARAWGPGVAAVVLSGMGTDGMRGVRAVKRAGGRVIAEPPDRSSVGSMPAASTATGCVDALLTPEEAGRWIGEHCTPVHARALHGKSA